jgi:hypothetical protein
MYLDIMRDLGKVRFSCEARKLRRFEGMLGLTAGKKEWSALNSSSEVKTSGRLDG